MRANDRVLVLPFEPRDHRVELGILNPVQLLRVGLNRSGSPLVLHRQMRHFDQTLVMIAHHAEEILIGLPVMPAMPIA